MIGMTMCSGIGAPEMAAPWVDWRFASEIEPFPRAVLQERFGYRLPEDHNQGDPLLWGDMTEITPELLRARGIPLPDLIVAGTPCQAFSVAGLRQGVKDARGNLTLKFVEIVHAIVDARPDGKLAVCWENVPGVLSDKGNAFGSFLGGLVGAVDAILPCPRPRAGKSNQFWKWHKGGEYPILDDDGEPTGKTEIIEPGHRLSWPGEGMVQGPRARAAWAVLDAQWFGVAQRRRRLFVVVDFGNCCDPGQILLEPDSLRGDSPPRRETGQVAPTIPSRSTAGGGLGTDFDCDGGLISSTGSVAHCLNAGAMGRIDYETETMIAHAAVAVFDPNQVTSKANRSVPTPELSHTLPATANAPVAFDCLAAGDTGFSIGDIPGALHGGGKSGGRAAVAFDLRGRDGGAMPEGPHDTANLRAASGGSSRSYIAHPWAVRRLTPTECARLQDFPDDHTAITYRGKPAADGPQYKAYGNSMAVCVPRYILNRLRISRETMNG